MKVLVTGASGFVGAALLTKLSEIGCDTLGAFRFFVPTLVAGAKGVVVGDLGDSQEWRAALIGVATVVHTAARVHVMSDKCSDSLREFRRVNVDGTATLAYQAAAAGVKRFVYLSSIKVNGEFTEKGKFFTADDKPAPEDPYGVSKYEAEQLLWKIGAETGMEIVVIRPPLVYGPGVKANFQSMLCWLARRFPLPLAALIHNRRSLVALDNLVDLIVTCIFHSAAANQIFLVSDGEDLSTAQLLMRIGSAMGTSVRLFYLPSPLLKLGATLLNKRGVYQRLCGSLRLDISKTKQLLGWAPPLSVDEGLRRTAEGFSP